MLTTLECALSISHRAKDGILWAPTVSQSYLNKARSYFSKLGPFCERARFPVYGKHMSILSITHLLFSRSPSTVRFTIIPVVINTFNCMFRRAMSHVIQKCFETIEPFLTHSNSPSAVIFVPIVARVKASRFHTKPCAVFMSRAASCMPVCRSPFNPELYTETAATMSVSRFQTCPADNSFASAFTTTQPLRAITRIIRNPIKNFPAAKLTINEIYEFHIQHNIGEVGEYQRRVLSKIDKA